MKKICVLTDSRAEYGHLFWFMKEVVQDPELELQIIATGSHLLESHGLTYKFIEADGFHINSKVYVPLKSDQPGDICESVGDGIGKMARALLELKPDITVILGDRYEMMGAAIACHITRTPIAHIHGGEVTEGAIDDAFRHSITKMSLLHFVSNENHRRRVLQLGEAPERIFNFGAPGLDHCYRSKLLSKAELENSLQFSLAGPVAIVTYHPVTLSNQSSHSQIRALLQAINQSGIRAVFTKANVDADNAVINTEVADFCNKSPERFKFFDSLGQVRFLSALASFDVMIGNSSSGVIESSSFGLPVVNIGERQNGRDHGLNIISCRCEMTSIESAIQRALSDSFKTIAKTAVSPYVGDAPGKTSILIKETLKNFHFSAHILQKKFSNVNFKA